MNYRHPNRVRGNLNANRLSSDRKPDIDTIEIPSVKLGRFVIFSPGSEYGKYLRDLETIEDNQRGIAKGWFSVISGPIFVEYADFTASLKNMLATRARPRTFERQANKILGQLTDDLTLAGITHAEKVVEVNSARQAALKTVLETGDHTEEFADFSFLYEKKSKWGNAMFSLLSQPDIATLDDSGMVYGFKIREDREDFDLRQDIAIMTNDRGLQVPNGLVGGSRAIVPALRLHRELSAMQGLNPTIPKPPEVELGPIQIHRF